MTEAIDYNTDLEQLLKLHAEECESLSILHRNSYEKYNGRSNYINIPVIILSSAIGFATGIDIGYANMNIILGVSSIFVGIIKSIDTYFQLGKRAESHRLCSLQFQQINKKIQIELALVRSQRVDAKDMMNIIKTDIKNLFDIAPLIDQDVIKSFQKKYGKQVPNEPGKYTFDAHTPNLCNGLSIVTVNSARNKQDYEERSSRKSSRDGSPSRDNNDGTHNGSGGVTVVIDDAAIAKELQQRMHLYQQDQQQQQEQPQQHQQPTWSQGTLQSHMPQLHHSVTIENIPVDDMNNDINAYHASADLVSLHSTRASSVKSVRQDAAISATPSAAVSVTPSAAISAAQSAAVSATPSAAISATPSVRQSAAVSATPSAAISATPSAAISAAQSVRQSPAISATPSVRQSAAVSAAQSVRQSAAQSPAISVRQTPAISAAQSPAISVRQTPAVSAAPSVRQSPAISVRQSATHSVNGESSPPIQMAVFDVPNDATDATDPVPEIYAVPDATDSITTTTLQLTQQQLQQLLQMQQQMMLDLEGQDGEMM